MKRAPMNSLTVLSVVLGVLCLSCLGNVAIATENDAERPSVLGRWRWLDERSRANCDVHSDALPWFVTTTIASRPSWFDAFALVDASKLTPSLDSILAPSVTSTIDLSPIQSLPDAPTQERVVLYRGASISNLAVAPYDKRVFAYASGAWGEQNEEGVNVDAPGFTFSSWGGGVGQDWNLFGHGIVGYGIQGNETKLKPKRNGVYQSSLNTFAGYLHMSVFDALWQFDATFGMARNWLKQRRLTDNSVNSFSTSQWLLNLEFGARYDKGYTRIEPFVNGRIMNLNEPRKAEKFLNKSYTTGFSDASYRLKLGSRFSWEHETILATLKPYLLAAWAHEFGDRSIYTIGDATPFPVATRYGTHKSSRDRLTLGGGVDAAMRETLDLYFQYDVQFANDYMDYLFFAGLNKKF